VSRRKSVRKPRKTNLLRDQCHNDKHWHPIRWCRDLPYYCVCRWINAEKSQDKFVGAPEGRITTAVTMSTIAGHNKEGVESRNHNQDHASEAHLSIVRYKIPLCNVTLTQLIHASSISSLRCSQVQSHSAVWCIGCIWRQRCNECTLIPTKYAIALILGDRIDDIVLDICQSNVDTATDRSVLTGFLDF